MIKAIGICLTVAACGSMGMTWGGVYEKRPKQLAALDSALQLLETEIIYGATPLQEAMVRVSQSSEPEISGLFKHTAMELGKMEGVTAGEAWSQAVRAYKQESLLNDNDFKILKRFGASLGASDREDQAKHLELTRSQIKLAIVQAESASKKYTSMLRYLGFLGGLFLVLILY